MNVFNIANAFAQKKTRGWKRLYWLIDCHGTLIKGSYDKSFSDYVPYPDAQKVLQYLSRREDTTLILWTSSYPKVISEIVEEMAGQDIKFIAVNGNPFERNNELSDFSQKPYFNILIDDKAGFEPDRDWTLVGRELEKITGDKIL